MADKNCGYAGMERSLNGSMRPLELEWTRSYLRCFAGTCFVGLADLNSAKGCFEEALRICPSSCSACIGLGEVFFLSGHQREAKVMYEWAMKNDPGNVAAAKGLAAANRELGLPAQDNSLAVPETAPPPTQPPLMASIMQTPTFSAGIHSEMISHGDYFRYATLGLAVQRVQTEGIKGDFAEVGVYQGEMSRFIHALAPERRFFLFDTFEGFAKEDIESPVFEGMFHDTSAEMVLQRIGNVENIVVRKGYVPDTFAGLEDEQFAFVLSDLDLYKPTRQSLEFFYPRLARGGYLIVHDFNHPPRPNPVL